jgi:hypothetical protein
MSKESQKAQVTLKRRVTIKALVTDKFKDYLNLELTENVRAAKQRIQEIDRLIADPKNVNLLPQLSTEKEQVSIVIENETAQKKLIFELENDSIFNQGSIDGFVSVAVGDNLYEKLGGMEIMVKDGIVEKVTPVSSPLK